MVVLVRRSISVAVLLCFVVVLVFMPMFSHATVVCSGTEKATPENSAGTSAEEGANDVIVNACTCQLIDDKTKAVRAKFGMSCSITIKEKKFDNGDPYFEVSPGCRADSSVPAGTCRTTEVETNGSKATKDFDAKAFNKRLAELKVFEGQGDQDGFPDEKYAVPLGPPSAEIGDAFRDLSLDSGPGGDNLGTGDEEFSTDFSARARTTITGAGRDGALGGGSFEAIQKLVQEAGNNSGSGQGQGQQTPRPFLTPGFFEGLVNLARDNGSGGSGAGASGPIAYAPSTPSGPQLITNPSFDALNSQVTFADPLLSPYRSITLLGGNPQLTEEQQAVLVLVDRLDVLEEEARAREQGVLRNSFTESTANFASNVRDVMSGFTDVFDPVISYFTSIFPFGSTSSEEEEGSQDTTTVLTFEASDDILSAGDPTNVLWEVPKGPVAPAPDPFRTGSSEGEDSLREALDIPRTPGGRIATIADEPTFGGASTPPPAVVTTLPPSAPSATGGTVEPLTTGAPESEGGEESAGSVGDAIGTVVSAVGNGIKEGFLRVLSWFGLSS